MKKTVSNRSKKVMLGLMAVLLAITGWLPVTPEGWIDRAHASSANHYYISTVAGNGTNGDSGDGGPAIHAQMNVPYGMAASSGNMYIVARNSDKLHVVDAFGSINSISVPTMFWAHDIVIDKDGNMYIANTGRHTVLKRDTLGNVTIIAGTPGSQGYLGDGGLATDAVLNGPVGLELDKDGNLYVAEYLSHVVRRIDAATGIISTVAGNGSNGYSGDAGLAASAQLYSPFGLAFDENGDLYIADNGNGSIRKVDIDEDWDESKETISTFAGTGASGYAGDGGPATTARLTAPTDLIFDEDGNLFISEYLRIRKVDTTGTIRTVAGSGTAGYSGDGGEAALAQMNGQGFLAFDADGNLLVTGPSHGVVRKLVPFHKVTFDSNGGTAVGTQPVDPGLTLTEPADPTKTGHSFDGWFTDASLTTPYDFATVINADRTLYAKWTPIPYTVTFNRNGGDADASPASLTVNYGSSAGSLPAAPTRAGHTFFGWNTAPNGSGTPFLTSTVVWGDVTLYAQWTLNRPTNLVATPLNGEVALTWDAVPGATSYRVFKREGAGPYDIASPAIVTSPAYTATGLTNGTIYSFVVTARNSERESGASLEASATPDASLGPTPPPTPTPIPSNPESTWVRTVDIMDGKGGAVVEKATVQRATGSDGLYEDQVVLTSQKWVQALDRLETLGSDLAKLLFPDDKGMMKSLSVSFPKDAAELLSESRTSVELDTVHARIAIPGGSFNETMGDLQFRIAPFLSEEEEKAAERRALTAEKTLDAAEGGSVEAVGRSITIESNASGRQVDLVLPLLGARTDSEHYGRLVVYIEHNDGTSELVNGEATLFGQAGEPGIRVTVDRFGTFTILHLPNEHEAYIFGYEDMTFRPDRHLTRAEMAAVLSRVVDRSSAQEEITYTDVPEEHWANSEIDQATRIGLMIGYPDGSFKPDEPISRAEMATAIARLLDNAKSGAGFPDTAGIWAESSIRQTQAAGIATGYEDGLFRPDTKLTRAEAVAMIDRLLGRGPLVGAPGIWHDVAPTHWAYGYIQDASIEHRFAERPEGGETYVESTP